MSKPSHSFRPIYCFDIHAKKFEKWSEGKPPEEIGDLIDELSARALMGDAKFLRQFPFIGKLYRSFPVSGRLQ